MKWRNVLPLAFALILVLGFLLTFASLDYSSYKRECEELGEKFKWYKSSELWGHVVRILGIIGFTGVMIQRVLIYGHI